MFQSASNKNDDKFYTTPLKFFYVAAWLNSSPRNFTTNILSVDMDSLPGGCNPLEPFLLP